MDLLFVYGTLKTGQRNSGLLWYATRLRETRTRPQYKLVNCGKYPGLQHGDKSVEGELYSVDSNRLEILDQFEGELFARQLIDLEDARAYAYIYQGIAPDYEGTNWHERKREGNC